MTPDWHDWPPAPGDYLMALRADTKIRQSMEITTVGPRRFISGAGLKYLRSMNENLIWYGPIPDPPQ